MGKGDGMRVEIVMERWTSRIVTGKIFETSLCKFKCLLSLTWKVILHVKPVVDTGWFPLNDFIVKNLLLNEAQGSWRGPPGGAVAQDGGRVSQAVGSLSRYLSRILCKSHQFQNQITII